MKFQLKRRLFQLGLASVALATAFPKYGAAERSRSCADRTNDGTLGGVQAT